jgi:hypothetical protein
VTLKIKKTISLKEKNDDPTKSFSAQLKDSSSIIIN